MTIVVALAFTLVLLAGAGVVLTAEPSRQAVTLSVFGVSLSVLFLVLQAPDVALSQLAIGTVVVPLIVMLAVSKVRGGR